jgi:type II secretory pathway component GspD/PulD (secretin)/tetratricopeptide (TPR) repeat protein
MLAEGKPVAARAALVRVLRSSAVDSLPATERVLCTAVLEQAERSIKQLDAAELSLQKAELAVTEGDLLIAERQTQAASKIRTLSQSQQARVEALTAQVKSRRESLAPMAAGLISGAVADFDAGRYEQAKSALATVYRSGIELSAEQRRTVDTYQVRLVDLERTRGGEFAAADASLAVFQPGKVRKHEPAPGEPATAPASEPAPATASAAEPVAQPAPAPAPAAEPAPAPAAAPAASEPAANPAPAAAPAPAEPNPNDLVQLAFKADAQRMLAEADQAFGDGRFSDALRRYEQILASAKSYLTADEVKKAEDRANDCRVRLKQGGDLSGSMIADMKLIRERASAEFNNAVSQARAALAAGEIDKARTQTTEARLVAGRNKQYYSQTENDGLAKQVADLTREVDAAADKAAKERQNKEAAERESRAGKARTDAAADKERRVVERIDRVRALQREQKYKEAIQVLDEILFLDPGNPTALLLKDIISDVIVFTSYNDSMNRKAKNIVHAEAENYEATILPRTIVAYPPDWPAKSILRGEGGGSVESPENLRTMSMLENRSIPVAEFKGNHFSDVVAFLEQATGANFDVQWESLRQIGIEPGTRVSMKLTGVPAKVVLERVLKKVSKDSHTQADFSVDQGIVTIASADDIKRQVTTTTYNITDLLIEPTNATDIPTVDLQQIYAQANLRNNKADPFAAKASDGREQGLTPRHDRVRKITDLIQTTISPESWRENGGDVGSLSELSGTLVVKQTPKNHREIQGLLTKLREIRSMQISVETRFLLVDQSFFEQIGFDLDVYFGARSNQVTAASANDPTLLPSDFFDFTNNQARRRQVTGAGSITTGGTLDATVVRQGVVTPNRWSPIGAAQNSLGITQSLAGSNNFASQVLAQAPALGIAGTFLDDVQVDFLVKATQADKRSLSLTAPRLTFTNGQTSNVYVATQRSIVSDLTPVTSESAVAFDPQPTTIVANGVTLLVEGVISADRRYVTMNIETSISALLNIRTLAISAAVGGTLQSSATFGSFIELPEVQVTRVQTTVTVPDEGTVMLGGQRLVTEVESESGVPLLSKIPVINRFFTNRVEAKTESTLLILVKPTVLLQNEQEEREFPGLNDRLRNAGQ